MKLKISNRYIEVCNEKGEVTGRIECQKGEEEKRQNNGRRDVLHCVKGFTFDLVNLNREMGMA